MAQRNVHQGDARSLPSTRGSTLYSRDADVQGGWRPPRVYARTEQGECACDNAEPAPRDQTRPTTILPPDPTAPRDWQPLARVTVGNLFRVNVDRLGAFDDEIGRQSERDLALLRQRHFDRRAEDTYALMCNGGFPPTENVNVLIPPWDQVHIQDPRDQGPPT